MKAILVRFGIRTFRPTLRKAEEKLEGLRTVEGYRCRRTRATWADKSALTAACQQLIDAFLKPRFLPTIQPRQFNDPVDILGKWHGTKYRFVQRYRSGFPENLGEEFDALSPASTGSAAIASTSIGPSQRRMVLPASPASLSPKRLTH